VADRTVAEAVADLRLSDARLAQDIVNAKAALLRAVRQMERDAAVQVRVVADFSSVRAQFAREFGRLQDGGGIVIPVTLDTDVALEDLVALQSLATEEPVVVTVTANVDDALSELGALDGLVDTTAVAVAVTANIDDALAEISSLNELTNDVAFSVPVTANTDDAVSEIAALENLAEDVRFRIPVTLDIDDALAELGALENLVVGFTVPIAADPSAFSAAIPVAVADANAQMISGFAQGGAQAGEQFASSFGGAARTFLNASALTLGGFFALSLVRGFQRFTTIEDAVASLTVALGDATAAAEVLDDVLAVVRGTPFNLDQFAKAASQLISFGVEAEKVPRYLTAIGESAASQGSRANEFAQRLSGVFGQISAIGRISGEDLWSFAAVGVDALAILGNTFGKTSADMRDMISNGAVPAGVALDALAEGILNGTDGVNGATLAFAGTMARLRETLTGAIGGFQASTARFGVAIIDPIADTLTDGFTAATSVVDAFAGRIGATLGGIAESDGVQAFQEFLKSIPDDANGFVDALSGLGPALAPLAAAFGAQGFGALVGVLPAGIGNLIPTIAPLTAGLAALVAVTPELREQVVPTIVSIGEAVVSTVGAFGVFVGEITEEVVPALEQIAEAAVGLTPLIEVAGDLAIALGGTLAAAIIAFAEVVERIPVPILQGLLVTLIAYKAVGGITTIITGLGTALGGLGRGAKGIEGTIDTLRLLRTDANRTERAVTNASVAIAGAFAGIAIASEDATTRITGFAGAAASIATGAALAGGWGAAFAAAGVGVGLLAGEFKKARDEAAELERRAGTLAETLIEQFNDLGASNPLRSIRDEIGLIRDELDLLKNQDVIDNLIAVVGDDDLTKLDALRVSVGDILNVLRSDIGANGVTDALDAIIAKRAEVDALVVSASVDPIAAEALEVANDELDALIQNLFVASGIDVEVFTDDDLALLAAVLELSERETAEIERQIAARDRQAQRRQEQALEAIGYTREQLLLEASLATTGSTFQLGDEAALTAFLDGIVERLDLTTDQAAVFADVLGLAAPAARDAADGVADALDLTFGATEAAYGWEAAVRGVADAFNSIGGALDLSQAERSINSISESIIAEFSKPIKLDLEVGGGGGGGGGGGRGGGATAEEIQERTDRQIERVAELEGNLAQARIDAEERALSLAERIALAEADGALAGAAGLRAELELVNEPVERLEEQLAKALEARNGGGRGGGGGGRSAASRRGTEDATIYFEAIKQAAIDEGYSLFDFVFNSPDPRGIEVANSIDGFINKFNQDIAVAVKKAEETGDFSEVYRLGQVAGEEMFAGLAATFGPEFATEVVTKYFDVDTAIVQAQASELYFAFREQYDALTAGEKEEIEFVPDLDDFIVAVGNARADGGKDIEIPVDANPEEWEAWLLEFQQLSIEKDAVVKVDADLTAAQRAVEAYVRETNRIQATIGGSLAGDQSGLYPTDGSPTVTRRTTTTTRTTGITRYEADGGLVYFRDGGYEYPHLAHIAAAGTMRVFAEPETGGEAYIPLSPSKRGRSTEILDRVAEMFGMSLIPTDSTDAPPSLISMPPPPSTSVPTGIIERATAKAVTDIANAVTGALATVAPSNGLPDAATRMRMARDYDRSVRVGEINIIEAANGRRTGVDIVTRLSRLARRR
jgi:tape measure domain-containing protein